MHEVARVHETDRLREMPRDLDSPCQSNGRLREQLRAKTGCLCALYWLVENEIYRSEKLTILRLALNQTLAVEHIECVGLDLLQLLAPCVTSTQ